MRRAFILASLLAHPISAIAGPPAVSEPWIPVPLSSGLPSLHRALAPQNGIGQTSIVLETTRLSDLYRLHLIRAVSHKGDAASSISWGCWYNNTKVGSVRICPASYEIDGGDIIGSLSIERVPVPSQPITPEAITIAGLIKFGATYDEIMQTFGTETNRHTEKNGTVIIDWRYNQPLSTKQGRGFSTFGDLVVTFEHNTMTKIFFSQTTAD